MSRDQTEDKYAFISQHELKRFLAFKKATDEHTKRLAEWKAELMDRVDDGAEVEDGLHRVQVVERQSIPYKKGFDRAIEILIEIGVPTRVHGLKRFLVNRKTVSRFVNVK